MSPHVRVVQNTVLSLLSVHGARNRSGAEGSCSLSRINTFLPALHRKQRKICSRSDPSPAPLALSCSATSGHVEVRGVCPICWLPILSKAL